MACQRIPLTLIAVATRLQVAYLPARVSATYELTRKSVGQLSRSLHDRLNALESRDEKGPSSLHDTWKFSSKCSKCLIILYSTRKICRLPVSLVTCKRQIAGSRFYSFTRIERERFSWFCALILGAILLRLWRVGLELYNGCINRNTYTLGCIKIGLSLSLFRFHTYTHTRLVNDTRNTTRK